MLTFSEPSGNGNSNSAHSRRSFLRVGSLGLGGACLSLPQMLAAKDGALRGNQAIIHPLVKDRSVVFLFMHGGPSQIETFDPKMDAPSEFRSVTGEVKTSIPGVTFGATFPKLAKLAKEIAVVRSFTTGNGNHDIKPIVSADSLGANIGSLYSKVAGAADPDTGMPRNVALFPQAVDKKAKPVVSQFGNFLSPGPLGAGFAPFAPGNKGDLQSDMVLSLPRGRMEERRYLLKQLDDMRRALEGKDKSQDMDRFQQQAFDTVMGGVANAFILSDEDPKTIARYDTAPLVNPASISKKWKNHEMYRDHGQTLGKLMLMARRLCEQGAGFVTVTTNFVWDMHADKNNATMSEGLGYVGAPFDHAVSAFIEDVKQRGLSEKILLVCCGEMGRNPTINKNGGRDHWGRIAPLMIYGGGLNMGQVIGESTSNGGEPASSPVTMQNLIATIMHSLLDIGQVRLVDGLSQDYLNAVTGYSPIRGLV